MTTSEFNDHKMSYETNDDYIKKCNEKADASGDMDSVHCGHNFTSDFTDEEYKQFISGFGKVDESELEPITEPAGGRHLETLRNRIYNNDLPNVANHKKWMGPVKNQGSCKSCTAFTAASVLEATIAKKHGDKDYYERISEQHLNDCTLNTE